jgi:hypothetical protein
MSADLTKADEDAAFRARLAPLASEVLPGAAKPIDIRPESTARPITNARRQLVAPAATARPAAAAVSPPTARRTIGAFRWPAHWWPRAPTVQPPSPGKPRRRPRWLGALSRIAEANANVSWRTGWWFVALAGIAVVIVEAWLLHRPPPATASARLAATVHTDMPSLSPTASEDMVGLLMQRGDAALAEGDIIAARLLFERAAALGSGAAAMAAAKTYDGDFLLRAGARGIRADPAAALAWIRKAAALGDPEARAQLAGQSRPSQSKP